MTNPIQYPNAAARLRAKLLGQALPPNKPIVIDGETYFIRSPLMADRTKIGEIAGLNVKAKKDEKTGEVSVDMSQVPLSLMIAAACIVLAVDEVGNALFTPADLTALEQSQAGGWVQQLGEACFAAANGEKKVDVQPPVQAPGAASSTTLPIASSEPSPN